jgi:hypothetical protein
MLELQRLLAEYKARAGDARDVPVFDDASFRSGKYSDGAVLKFRGIIRDVFDPELVLLSDAATAENAPPPPVQELTGDKFIERVPLKVALVPHVNGWAVQRYIAAGRTESEATAAETLNASAATTKGTKRPNDALAVNDAVEQQDTEMGQETDAVKKPKPTSEKETVREADAPQFPEAVVSIYVYDGQYKDGVGVDAFKVNESFEFIGVLDLMVMPSGGTRSDDGFTAQTLGELTISDCLEDIQRRQQSSVVLHCCDAQRLDALHFVEPHTTLLLATNAARRERLATRWQQTLGTDAVAVGLVREKLLEHLAHALGGDALAAEYTLMCLLSRVYSRPDNATALGNLSVNLSFEKNVPPSVMATSIEKVSQVLQSIVPMLSSVDMTIQALNDATFLPHKDYDHDVLRGGSLQFAHGTVAVVNETVLSAGKLNDQGVKNVAALQSLVDKMLLPYDFQYYSMDFPQDVAVVSFSQGKSILPVHVSVPIEMSATSSGSPVSEAMLECFRLFLAVLRASEVALGNDQAEIAEKHFVACRKAKQEVSVRPPCSR